MLNETSVSVSLPPQQHDATTVQNQPKAPSAAVTASSQAKDTIITPRSSQDPSNLTLENVGRDTSSEQNTVRSSGPVVPAVPMTTNKVDDAESILTAQSLDDSKETSTAVEKGQASVENDAQVEAVAEGEIPAPVRLPPSSWANLFTRPPPQVSNRNGLDGDDSAIVNQDSGKSTDGATNGTSNSNFARAMTRTLAGVVRDYRVGSEDSISFLEPRGLINTGNMCYMNSVSLISAMDWLSMF